MSLTSWLESLRTGRSGRAGYASRRGRVERSRCAEELEPRALLTVSTLLIGSELNVFTDAADSIAVRANVGGQVEILANGAVLTTAPTPAASTVTAIVVTGSDANNVLDLSGVSATQFTALTSLSADGGDGHDSITGSADFADSLVGGNGRDTLNGQGGNDTLIGGDGADVITGGLGNDSILGGNNADTITGDAGNDTIEGGDGADSLNGGDGDDSVLGGNGADSIDGGLGDDTLNADGGNDTVTGNGGNDSILGGADNDVLRGNDGNDDIDGQSGHDTLEGNIGDDSLQGNGGNDLLLGDVGNDFLNGSSGDDSLEGGNDNDTLQGGAGHDALFGESSNPSVIAFGDDVLKGQGGNDTLDGGGGNDQLSGGDGNDVVNSGFAEPTPDVSINDVTLGLETDFGFNNLTFTVTLSVPSAIPVSVDFMTVDGTAQEVLDYERSAGTIIFAPHETTRTISVPIRGEILDEFDEQFSVVLSNPVNANLSDDTGVGMIVDDDFTPTLPYLNISDAIGTGEGGPTKIIIAMDTSGSTGNIFSGTPVGDINGDGRPNTVLDAELDAVIRLNNQIIADGRGSITVIGIETFFDSDGERRDMNPNGGNQNLLATAPIADLNGDSVSDVENVLRQIPRGVIIDNTTLLGAAITTFQSLSTQPSEGLLIVMSDGFISGANQTQRNTLINMGVSIRAFAVGTATNLATMQTFDPSAIAITSSDELQQQFALLTAPTTFEVSLSAPATNTVTVDYTLVSGTGTVGVDFIPLSGTLVFPPGTQTQTIFVAILQDATDEPNENFFVQLSNPVNATIADGEGHGTIVDDDGTTTTGPTATITGGGLLLEGNTGTTNAVFTVTLSAPSTTAITIDFATSDESALASDVDYLFTAGTLTFPAGTTSQTILVPIVGDLAAEPDETFVVNLSNPRNVLLNGSRAQATLLDDDSGPLVPIMTVEDISLLEGNGGTTNAVLTLTLNRSSANPSQLSFTTVDGTAVAGNDYIATSGTVIFTPGQVTQTISIPVIGDSLDELGEFFTFVFSGESNLVFSGVLPQVFIADDEGLTSSTPYDDTLLGDSGDDTLTGAIGNDVLNGGGGNDRLQGRSGNDGLFGGANNDTLSGDDGSDTLNGQSGNDLVDGGVGDDQLVWALDGNDSLSGGTGFDSVLANGTGASDSLMIGQAIVGEDVIPRLTVTSGGVTSIVSNIVSLTVNGNGGDDSITVGSVNQVDGVVLMINGGSGNDSLSAAGAMLRAVRLRLNGDAGNDTLTGSVDRDTLDGGDGDDLLSGGLGNDSQIGGLGNDVLNGNEGNDSLNGGDGDDTLRGNVGNDAITGGEGNDSVLGGDGADTVAGDAGEDTIGGDAGNDSLSGGTGADTISGGDGADTLDGGTLGDSLSGDAGDDLIRGGDGDDSLDGGDGNDSLIGGDGDDLLLGGAGNDGINAGHGNDTLSGQAGKDTLLGSDGADVLLGGADIDTLLGGDGDDTLNGQGGQDLLAGNEGVDTLNDASAVIDEAFVLSASVLTALEA